MALLTIATTTLFFLSLLPLPSNAMLDLTLLHTNDFHSRIEQTSRFSSACSDEDADANACFGGVARLHTALDEIRNRPGNTLLLDGGDQFQGTLWFNEYEGLAAAHFMNRNGYQAMALGNHEFDNGASGLTPFLNNVTFPVLSCNIDASNEPSIDGLFQPSTVIEVDGTERVGIVGYTIAETPFLVQPEGVANLVFNDEVTSLQAEVDRLIGLGINKVIVLGHGGYLLDQRIAREVRGVDIVVGGHSNSFLYNGNPDDVPSNEDAEGPYPTVVTQDDGSQVLVVQAYAYGKYLGYLEVTFDDDGVVTEWDGNPILLDGSIEQDPEILVEVKTWAAPLEEIKTRLVGESFVFMEDRPLCRLAECGIGNAVADAMLLEFMTGPDAPGDPWTDVSLVMVNGGGLRSPTEQGPITMGQVLQILPFRNEVVRVTLRGDVILEILEHSASRWTPEDADGAFLQFSGVQVTYDVTKAIGQRVMSAKVRCHDCTVPSFIALDMDEEYNVLITSFMASGGDGYSMIPENVIETRNYGNVLADVFANYLQKRSPIIQGIEGRITIITEDTMADTTTMAPCTSTMDLGTPLPPSGSMSIFRMTIQHVIMTLILVILVNQFKY